MGGWGRTSKGKGEKADIPSGMTKTNGGGRQLKNWVIAGAGQRQIRRFRASPGMTTEDEANSLRCAAEWPRTGKGGKRIPFANDKQKGRRQQATAKAKAKCGGFSAAAASAPPPVEMTTVWGWGRASEGKGEGEGEIEGEIEIQGSLRQAQGRLFTAFRMTAFFCGRSRARGEADSLRE